MPDELFVNGRKEWFPPVQAGFVQLLADTRRLGAAELEPWLADEEALHWLADQMASGHWFLDTDE